ncbi:MAG: nitroreductase family deazaflavin-dependent oxidoreductase [Actinomycetota bacterium]
MGIQQELGSIAPAPNALQRIVHRVAGSAIGGALLARIAPPLDKVSARASGGRGTSTQLLTGLPIIMLTTTGARSGQARTHPVLGIPFGEDLGLQSGNFGVTSVPAWVHNLRANPEATIEYGGRTVEVVARDASEAETAEILGTGTALFAGLANYGRRANRTLDVFVLQPAES